MDLTKEEIIEKINQAEEKFLKKGLLKFQENIFPESKLDDFLVFLIKEQIPSYPTFLEDNKLDLEEGRHRSIEDIFRITRFYKNVSLLEVIESLMQFSEEGKLYKLWCRDIEKITFFTPGSRNYGNSQHSYSIDRSLGLSINNLKFLCNL